MLLKDCYEVVKVDGVYLLCVFFKVMLLLIKGFLFVVVVFWLLDVLCIFDLIFVLIFNSGSIISMFGFVWWEMVDNGNFGFGLVVFILLIIIIFVIVVLFLCVVWVKLLEELL